MIVDVEAGLVRRFAQKQVQALFERGRKLEIRYIAAASADYVVVVFDNLISQLIAGEFAVSREASYHPNLFKNGEISVDA